MGFAQSIAAFEPQARGPATESRPGPEFPSLIGASPSFRAAVAMAKRVAAFPAANVLLVGETGTGKELFARAIHNASAVADDPFVAINCSAIPEAMLESELFGHEKGAFTDARSSKRGLLQVAGRGTIMLDEVQDLSPSLQPKLLRVLEERRVRRLGALTEYDVDCRIIAAANKDLASPTEEGRFRSDLYYRLSVVRIDLPSLRKRPKDLELLACHFLETLCREYELPIKRLADEAMAVLRSHSWLGNVRELKNTLESAVVMCDGQVIRPEQIRLRGRTSLSVTGDIILRDETVSPQHSPLATTPAPSTPIEAGVRGNGVSPTPDVVATAPEALLHVPPGGVTLGRVECELLRETLRLANGNRSLAARMLGVSRPTVLRKIARYELH